MSKMGFVRSIRTWLPVTAALAFCVALCGGTSASALPLRLFSSPFPACLPEQLVYGPQESIWFLLRACKGTKGSETPISGVGRLPLNGPSALIVQRVNKLPESLAVGPEGDLWFTEDTYEASEGDPTIGRLTGS